MGLYTSFGWMYTVLRWLAPNTACTLSQLGLAMIHAVTRGGPKAVLEVPDLIELSKA